MPSLRKLVVSPRVTTFDDFGGNVNEIDVRVAPIDVGFDLRGENMVVRLPAGTRIASYEHNGERLVVEGKTSDVARVLRAAGYRVAYGR
jgi:hypothetical protein